MVLRVSRMPDDLDLLHLLQRPPLHPAGDHGAPPGDGEHVLDGHEEGLVDVSDRLGDEGVHGVHELQDPGLGCLVALQGLEGGQPDHRDLVAGELVGGQQLADLQLHQVKQLGVIDHVHLVQGHHDGRHVHLAGQQDVLPGLGHGAVGGRDHQDGPVHLGRSGDHVLDVVGVPGAVHVGVVAGLGLVLHVGDGDGDPPLPLLRGLVDLVEGGEVGHTLVRPGPW